MLPSCARHQLVFTIILRALEGSIMLTILAETNKGTHINLKCLHHVAFPEKYTFQCRSGVKIICVFVKMYVTRRRKAFFTDFKDIQDS